MSMFFRKAVRKSPIAPEVAARQMRSPVIAAVSDSGGAARLLSEYRPEARIVAFTARLDVLRQLAMYWGVQPEPCPSGHPQLVRDTMAGFVMVALIGDASANAAMLDPSPPLPPSQAGP